MRGRDGQKGEGGGRWRGEKKKNEKEAIEFLKTLMKGQTKWKSFKLIISEQ